MPSRQASQRTHHTSQAASLESDWRIDRAISAFAQTYGSAPAIETAEGVLTYAELDARSNRLGRRLAAEGVRRGDIVVLACDCVEDFALGALAIMKLGAAYLAVDLRFPGRSRAALAASAARYAIVPRSLDTEVESLDIPMLHDAFAPEAIAGFDDAPLDEGVGSDDPAYLCYTSGTSGVPKGALIAHRGVFGLSAHADFSPLRGSSRIACCCTFAFDAIVFEVWSTLINGACIVSIDRAAISSPREIATTFAGLHIDCACLTTSLFNAVVTGDPSAFHGMKMLVGGGEPIDPTYVHKMFEAGAAPARLVNGYGPTEATVLALSHIISPQEAEAGCIPIGRTFSGRYVRILREDLTVAEPGEPGELHLGGPALALRYENAPEITAEKFIADPFSLEPGARLYRTGDLGRMREDGVVEFLGRVDDQVKVRGYRIEPAGVAALLRQIEGIDDALVLPRQVRFSTKEIVAFLKGPEPIPAASLKSKALALLPDYMMPAAFFWVDDFPLTANGKVDAKQLLGLTVSDEPASSAVDQGAQDPEESVQKLLSIWRRNTGRSDIGPDTPFDDIGDSLSLIGVIIDVEAELGVALSPFELDQPITIQGMARYVSDANVARAGNHTGFYISQPWNMKPIPTALGDAIAGDGGWRQLQFKGLTAPDAFSSIEHMAEVLERQLPEPRADHPITLVGHSFGGVLAYELARRLEARRYPIARIVLIDSFLVLKRNPLDFLWVSIVRACLLAVRAPGRLVGGARHRLRAAFAENKIEKIIASSIAASSHYRPGPVRSPLLLISCAGGVLNYASLKQYRLDSPWERLNGARLKRVSFACDHAEVIDDPVWVGKLAATISSFNVRPS